MDPGTLYELGIQSLKQGKTEEAVNYLKKSLSLAPDNIEVLYNLAHLFRQQNNFSEAISYFTRIIKIQPAFFEAFYYLADTLYESGDLQSGALYYQKAIALNPKSYASVNNLGNIFIELGDLKKAMEYFQEALALKPDSSQILNNIGYIYGKWKDYDSEIKYYLKAIELDPGFIQAYNNVALAYEKIGKIAEARHYYQKVLESTPDDLLFKLHIDTMCPVIPFNNEEIDNYRKNLLITIGNYIDLNIKFDLKKIFSANPRLSDSLVYQGREELPLRLKFAEIFKNSFPVKEQLIAPLQGKPHIGMVVTKKHEGIFCRSMRGILNNFNPEQFNITIICNNSRAEPFFRQMLINPSINYLFLKSDFIEIIEIMPQQKFDILYYFEAGTSNLNYFMPFCRFAPVQCTSWGWQVTTGIPEMDYYISSELTETENSATHYSEKLIRLKSLPVYYYRPPVPEKLKSRNYFGIEENRHVYLCAQNLRKIHPDFDRIIAEILRRDNNSTLILIKDRYDNITEMLLGRLKHYYPDIVSRIKFMPRMNEADYLNLISVCDIALDTIYYGGVNTSYDALGCGTPVVTMPSEYHRGRYTYGIYKAMGIFDCVAYSQEEYIELALKIAGNPQIRADISHKIKEKDYLVFENKAAVTELADFFQSLY